MPLSSAQDLIDLRLRQLNSYLPIRRFHWFVVIGSLVVTLAAWQLSSSSIQERTHSQFERQGDYAINLFKQEMGRYAEVLRSGVGFVAGSEEVRPEEWREFTQRMALEDDYAAIGGMGVVYRVAKADITEFIEQQRIDRPDFTIRPAIDFNAPQANQYVMPLTLISPQRLEDSAPGLDLAREARRLDAMERAIQTGNIQITAPIKPDSVDDTGFILVAPIFQTANPKTEALRRSQFVGAVVAAVVTKNLASGILNSDMRQVALRVSDDTEVMYNDLDNDDIDPQPLMTSSQTLPFYGREWRFDIHSTRSFRLAHANSTPTLILIGGLVIDTMLLLLFLHMSREHQRSTIFGRKLTQKYELQSKALVDRCDELEAFSYLVSHDLKAPLRSIGFLAQWFVEDYEDHYPDTTLHPDLMEYLKRINTQVVLAQGLIKGVMQYSSLSTDEEKSEEVNILDLLQSLRVTLSVGEEQLQLVGEFPTMVTCQVQLTQVLMNLIGNGYKYHHGHGLAVVTVKIEPSPLVNYYRFSVSDNGPGIPPAYHETIFAPFVTLQPKDHSMSSGVGLAIVKKLINSQGGDIELVSGEGEGACFRFDWPSTAVDQSGGSEYAGLPKAA